MLLALKKPQFITFPKTLDFFFIVSFLYFYTLHADLLQLRIAGFAIRLNNLIGIALFVAMALRYHRDFFFMKKEVALPLILMTFCVILSFILSPYKKRCSVFLGFYGMTLLIYFWLPYQMLLKFGAAKVLKSYLSSFVFVGLTALPQLVGFVSSHFRDRPRAFTYEPSYLALYMTPFIVMATIHYICSRDKDFYITKKINRFSFLLYHVMFVISFSSSAFVSYLLLAALLLAFLFVRQFHLYRANIGKFLFLMVASIGVLFAILPKYIPLILLKVVNFKYLLYHHSFQERLIANRATWAAFTDASFTGVGLGGFPSYRFSQWLAKDPRCMHYLSYDNIMADPNPIRLFESSNVFLEMLATFGVGGICVMICFMCSFFYLAKRSAKTEYIWTLNFVFSTAIMMLVLQINQGLLRTYVWVHVALAFAYFVKTIQSSGQDPLSKKSA